MAKLTSYKLKPIKKIENKRYISASTLKKRQEARSRPSIIPALASGQLVQLINDTRLIAKGMKLTKLNDNGRSIPSFIKAALPNIKRICLILSRSQSANISKELLAYLPKHTDRFYFAKDQAAMLGQSLSTMVHITLWHAFTDGLKKGGQDVPEEWRKDLRSYMARYRRLLAKLQEAAKHSDIGGCSTCLFQLTHWALSDLPDIAKMAGGASSIARADVKQISLSHLGIQISVLSRKVAMLAGAAALLCQKITNSRTRKSTSKLAEKRTVLMRDEVDVWSVDALVHGTSVGDLLDVFGKADDVLWEERPQKPVSIIKTKDSIYDLVVPYKSVRRQGLAPGSFFWCKGKLKEQSSSKRYIEIEQEGPGQYEDTIWEDWLAVQARQFYDLYPASLQMEWEFPAEGYFGSKLDFLSRLR